MIETSLDQTMNLSEENKRAFDEVAAIVVFLLWPFAGILFAIYQFGNLIMLVGNTIRKLL